MIPQQPKLINSQNAHSAPQPNPINDLDYIKTSVQNSIRFSSIEPRLSCGPMKIKLPEVFFNHLMQITDQEIEERGNDLTHGIVARVYKGKGSFQIREKLSEDFKKFLIDCSEHYKELLGINNLIKNKSDMPPLTLDNAWTISQESTDYNPLHWHYGKLSGVIYLKVPQQIIDGSAERTRMFGGSPTSLDGKMEFIYWPSHPFSYFSEGSAAITPIPGDMYIFPAWLPHTVYPFVGDGERRIVSFNLI
jgi:Putative 2OG-Fe(II) oxygenase